MNRIVALWCHPRSMSTSVERLMRERGDLQCLHEPFMYHYYLNHQHREMPHFEPKADHPVQYESVRDMILQKAQTSPVFFKDMGYYVETELVTDVDFCAAVTHCFLIRNPRASIASYYALDKAVTLHEIGYEAQWNLYCHLVNLGIRPVVLQAEAIRKETRAIIGKWWESVGLTPSEKSFEWDTGYPADWDQVKGWHQNSISTSSIQPWTTADGEIEQQRFKAAVREAEHLETYLAHHEVYYKRLKNVALHSA